MCLIAEMIHSCSHEKVAQAAVASVGADFAGKVSATAGAQGLSAGAFAARVVREFEKRIGENRVDEKEIQSLRAVMDRADQPILSGLKHILAPAIAVEFTALPPGAQRMAGTRQRSTKQPSSRSARKPSSGKKISRSN